MIIMDAPNINKEDIETIKLSLFSNLCNATGIYRKTLNNAEKEIFDKNAEVIIKDLIVKVDLGSIRNIDIRNAIRTLSRLSGLNEKVGASQKVINVYLKYYCVVAHKSDLLVELDCPIDSLVRTYYKLGNFSMKNMTFGDYIRSQEIIGDRYPIRVMADVPAYDETKIIGSKV